MAYNIADLFEHAVDKFPDRLAVACEDERRTFAELEARANQLAHHLAANGVGEGSHVGLCTRNRIEAVETILAVYKLRAVIININYRYVAGEVRYILDDADVVAVVHERRFAPAIEAALPDVPGVKHVLVIEDGTEVPARGESYEAALAGQSTQRDFDERSNDDVYILYTGGTTGMPKGVMWRHEDVWRVLGGGINFMTGEPQPDEFAQSAMGEITGGLTRLSLGPIIHGNGQWAVLMALFGGDPVVLLPDFDAKAVWEAVQRHKANVIVLIGDAMARPIIEEFNSGSYDASSVYAISSSAALFSQAVKDQYLAALPNTVLTDSVGSSETGFQGIGVVTKDSGQTAGGPRITVNAHTIVIDDDNKRVEPGSGVVGRLARGGHIPLGYWKDPEKTAKLFVEVDGERYTVPGDFAVVEEDGSVILLGRGTYCINTGGEKVFPEEVEAALKSHPDVYDLYVIGVPDERYGQAVAAVVQPREGAAPTASSLIEHARLGVAGYKVPRHVWLVNELPRLMTGKADYKWAIAYAADHLKEDLCAPSSVTT
jgi:acyl-CoA synthetase (AMP-forming)/AMP-acid ligase II